MQPEHNNYKINLQLLMPAFGPGVHHVYVAHDDWCGIFSGGRCNCGPDIHLEREQAAAKRCQAKPPDLPRRHKVPRNSSLADEQGSEPRKGNKPVNMDFAN